MERATETAEGALPLPPPSLARSSRAEEDQDQEEGGRAAGESAPTSCAAIASAGVHSEAGSAHAGREEGNTVAVNAELVMTADPSAIDAVDVAVVSPMGLAMPRLTGNSGAQGQQRGEVVTANGKQDERKEEAISEGTAHPHDEQRAIELRAREMELFQGQLEKEMLKRRPDHFIIGVICRSLGGVPDHMRSSVWKEILGVTRSERLYLDQSILRVEEDLENQKVISADACRTRGNDAYFKQPETVELITKLLTYYCKCRNVRYKQGMNEVLAPFLILERDPPMPEGVVFQCFYAMIDKFLPHVFVDREFKSLQCSFQLYRLLMLYHDPKLCHYLDQHDMTPELYVTPWFMTLFARNLKPELVFLLWDFFLLEEHPFLMHFIAYAMVDASKEKIMSAEIAMLPQVLSSITFGSKSELEAICEKALQLAQTTPRSFERDLYAVCYGGFNDSMLPFMRQISGASSLQVYPDELVANLLKRISAKAASMSSPLRPSETKREDESLDPLLSPLSRNSSFSTERNASASSVFFIVLDCRPIEQYRECHLSLSYHIDPEVVGSPDALSVLIKGFSRMKGCHFCFVGPSDPSSNGPKSSNIAFDTISRLARGISGEKKSQTEVQAQAPPASAPAGLNLPASPGVPGSGANDIISKEGAASGNRILYFEHISVTRLVLMFLQKGFEHISRLDGGFEELKKEIMSMDTFTQDQLLVHAELPSPPPTSTSTGFKLFSKIGLTRLRSAHSEDMTNADSETVQQESSNASILSKPSDPAVATRPKAKVATFSQRFQTFTAAAKDAVSQGANSVSSARMRSKSNPDLTSPVPEGMSNGLTDERQLVGEEEWVEVCLRTKEALEKSLAYKEVVFQTGSMGILLQKSKASKKYQAVVDSIVPESQASESQQMDRGDLLVSVNGQSMENVPFLSVIDLVKDAKRPVVLRFQNPNAKKALESFDAISIPPLAPTLVSASHHSIGITWSKLSLPNIRYHLQYAKQSEFNFNPWVSVVMKQDGSNDLSTSGITEHTNGTMVGLDPGQSFVFRVRCGDGEKWGPYSLSSNPISTLEKSADEASDDGVSEPDAATGGDRPVCGRSSTEPVFLPGSCPVFVEQGLFYYKVIISLRARKLPAFDAEKLDVVFEKGSVIKCTERMVAPGTNQIFVRIASDDASVEGSQEALDEDQILADASGDEEDVGVWAFENTPEGTVVLERLPEEYIMEEPAASATLPLQEQAKSVVSSIFSGGAKSNTSNTTGSSEHTRVVVVHIAPKILQVFPVSPSSIVVTWDPINDVGVTKYQIQYSKNRLTAMWWNANQEIQADTLKYTVNDLMPNTAYLFRIRGFNSDSGWGPYSESSESCKTPPVEVEGKEPPKPEPAPVASGAESEKDEQRTSSAGVAAPDRISASRTGSGNNFRLPVGSIFSAPSSSTTSTPPLRTGSTFLDKAVAAASRLTARRRSLSSSSTSATSSNVSAVTAGQESDEQEANDEDLSHDQMMEEENGITYVNLGHWKKDPNGTFQDFRFYAASQYGQSGGDSCGSKDTDGESSPGLGGLHLNKVGERDLVVTPTSLFILNSWASKREGFAVLEHSRMLESLVKITSQKSVKNLVVFHFKDDKYTESADTIKVSSPIVGDVTPVSAAATDEKVESEDASQDETDSSRVGIDRLYFVVNDPDACVGLVRQYYEQLMS